MSRPTAHELAEALVALTAASLKLRLRPFSAIVGQIRPRLGARPATAAEADCIRRAIEAWARRLPWRPKCFAQGLAADSLLGRRGLASTLHYGAATIDDVLKAHVWVTSGEVPVIGCDQRGDFAPLARYPGD